MKYFDFSIVPTKPLHENAIFWWVTITPCIVSILLVILLIPALNFEISVEGYKYFLTAVTLPLGIASISIVLGVMIGRFHGSKQRAMSISQNEINYQLARKSQTFQHYFEHRTQFENWLKSESISLKIVGQTDTIDVNAMGLYDLLFSKNTVEYLEYSVDRYELFHQILTMMDCIGSELIDKADKGELTAEMAFFKLLSFLSVKPFKAEPNYWAPYHDKEAFIDLAQQIPQVIYKSTEFLLLTGLDNNDSNLYEIFDILIDRLEENDFFEKLGKLRQKSSQVNEI